MKRVKSLAWESWNSKFDIVEEEKEAALEEDEEGSESESMELLLPSEALFLPPKTRSTPMGEYAEDSLLKPSDRWDCWICHTNFDITNEIVEIIEEVCGVEVLKIMGRYSFFIGVAKMFDIKEVRHDIESALCTYTEEEIFSDKEINKTVNLVKEQLQTTEYWSILVSPHGDVEYISSEKMDKAYLDGLVELTYLKGKIGGIILRSSNG
tara:strand:+ start:673 stop:1299 length:627 start_codon:yes stop_codon:yes gene_type:complete